MRIGDVNIPLRNMSKNKRRYWKVLKRVYDEATHDGLNIDPFEYIEQNAITGKITQEMLFRVENTSTRQFLSYATNVDFKQLEIENIISWLEAGIPRTERGRRRVQSYGRQLRYALANKVKNIVKEYGYNVAYDSWYALPYETRAKMNSSIPSERYKAFEEALGMLDQLVDVVLSDNNYEDYEE